MNEATAGEVIHRREGSTLRLELCQPRRRNALSPFMLRSLRAALGTAETDQDVRLVVISGAGEGPFSSGYDIGALHQETPDDIGATAVATAEHEIDATVQAIRRLPVPVAAFVRRYSIGASLEILAACDLRFCAPGCYFTLPALRVGVAYGVTGIRRLSRAFSEPALSELIWSPRGVDAERARQLGIVHDVVPEPPTSFLDARLEHLSNSPRAVVGQLKRNLAAARACHEERDR
ncbi:enoyl-CoA hydratase/isomerase family protein [Actinophytocola sp.]|uniref:enoyl-CoA hydratase/isomerase family protein n=1 Tax=Actinophytocola sp. TaxID=1872138 RepID=UPI003D6B7126